MDSAPQSTALAPLGSTAMALRPTSLDQAIMLAERLSGNPTLPAEFQKPASILLIILKSADLGLSIAQAFAGLHVINGRVTMSAQMCVGLVRRERGLCKVFRVVEETPEKVTYEAQRDGEPPIRASFEIAEARKAGLIKPNSNWEKFPSDMLHARAAARAARRAFPDVLLGMPPIREEVIDGVVDLQEDGNGQWSAPPPPAVKQAAPTATGTTRPVSQAQTPVTAQQPIEATATPVTQSAPTGPPPTLIVDDMIAAMLLRIEGAKSVAQLEALVPDMQSLPEGARTALRGPYRAAKELFLRMSKAPATTANTTPKPVWSEPGYGEAPPPAPAAPEADREPGSDDE